MPSTKDLKGIISIYIIKNFFTMLRITMNKSSAGAKKYYSEPYYNEGKNNQLNYYSEKDQVIGKWGGIGAEKLGLKDGISKDDFAALCDNKNPANDKKLTARNDGDRTVGYDFTFNASKSISLAYSFGNDKDKQEILKAFRESVADTMKEMETGMQARVRGKGRNENRETGNIAYGEFIHFTTRPIDGVPDPHLHAHCFVFNATYDEQDKKWKAGQFRQVKQDAPYYEAYFHSQLAAKLESIGYNIERTKNGLEISGVNKSTIDKFSRRTREIEEHARDNNITDEKQKANIGARTRESKRINIDAEQELTEWKSRLTDKEHLQLQNLKGNSDSGSNTSISAGEALEYSLNHHLERKSVASDKEILTTAIKASIGEVTPQQIKQAFYARADIISVKEDNRTFITTKEALNEEKQLIVNANSFKGKFKPINEAYEFKSELLNNQQKRSIQYALGSKDGITIITGKAGTGKTTLMKEVQQGITEAGKTIFAYAPSSEASRVVQRSEGFENADTLASLVQKRSGHEKLKNQMIWIDEAGTVSNKDLNKVFAIAKEQNARIILSGDTRQHNSVQRGDALRVLQKYAGLSSVTVNKIQRQKNKDYREAVELLSEAKIDKGFQKLDKIGAIKEVTDSSERIKAIADDYYKSSYKSKTEQSVLVIAPTHAEGEAVTTAIRETLKKRKVVEDTGEQFTSLKNLQYTEAEKSKINNYRPGDIIAFTQNVKGIKAGTKLEISEVEKNRIAAVDAAGIMHKIDLTLSRNFTIFEKHNIEIAKGDKIRITGNGKAIDGKHLFNGISYHVSGFDKQGNIKLSNGSTLPKDYGQFTFGYVMTSHSAQGKTSDKVIISQSTLSFRAGSIEQFYVSVSRGRQATAIYTDDKKALLQAVSQSVQRVSALELVEKKSKQNIAVERNRLNLFNKLKERALEKFTTTQSKNYELSGKNRKGPAKSR